MYIFIYLFSEKQQQKKILRAESDSFALVP